MEKLLLKPIRFYLLALILVVTGNSVIAMEKGDQTPEIMKEPVGKVSPVVLPGGQAPVKDVEQTIKDIYDVVDREKQDQLKSEQLALIALKKKLIEKQIEDLSARKTAFSKKDVSQAIKEVDDVFFQDEQHVWNSEDLKDAAKQQRKLAEIARRAYEKKIKEYEALFPAKPKPEPSYVWKKVIALIVVGAAVVGAAVVGAGVFFKDDIGEFVAPQIDNLVRVFKWLVPANHNERWQKIVGSN